MTAPRFPRLDRMTGRILDVDPPQPRQTDDLGQACPDVRSDQGAIAMDRRHASKLILTGALAAPALIRPGTGLASNEDEENERLARVGQMRFRLATGIVLLHHILVLSGAQWWGLNVQGDHRQFNEKRARIGGVFGRLTRQTMESRLRDAVILGQLFMLSNSLYFFPDDPRSRWNQKLLIAHRFISWEPREKLRKVSVANISPTQVRQRGLPVGVVAAVGVLLMILVNPILTRNVRLE